MSAAVEFQFTPAKPIAPEHLTGREELLAWILNNIRKKQSTYLCGGPKIGKTSILHWLCSNSSLVQASDRHKYLVGFLDAHELEGAHKPADFWRLLLNDVEEEAKKLSAWELFDECQQDGYCSDALRTLLRQLNKRHIVLVLLLDELECLVRHSQFHAEFFNKLRSWSQRPGNVVAVSTSRERKHSLEDYLVKAKFQTGSQALNLGDERILGTLSDDATMELLRKADGFNRASELVAKTLTGGHPYLVHVLGDLFGRVHNGRPLDGLLETIESWSREVWSSTSDDRARPILLLQAAVTAGIWSPDKALTSIILDFATTIRPSGLIREALQDDGQHLFPGMFALSLLSCKPWMSQGSANGATGLQGTELKEIRETLIGEFGGTEKGKWKMWCQDADLRIESINPDGPIDLLVQEILQEASRSGRLLAFLGVLRAEYPNNSTLAQLGNRLGGNQVQHQIEALLSKAHELDQETTTTIVRAFQTPSGVTAYRDGLNALILSAFGGSL